MTLSLSYTIEPRHLADYHIAARERVLGRAGSPRWQWDVLRGIVTGLMAVAVFLATSWGMSTYLGQALHNPSLAVGLSYGIAFILLEQIVSAVIQRRRSPFKAHGPTFAPHTALFSDDLFQIKGPSFEHRYQWPVFEGVTQHKLVTVVWLEPGAGVVIPRSAFADAEVESAFIEKISKHIEGTRAGS